MCRISPQITNTMKPTNLINVLAFSIFLPSISVEMARFRLVSLGSYIKSSMELFFSLFNWIILLIIFDAQFRRQLYYTSQHMRWPNDLLTLFIRSRIDTILSWYNHFLSMRNLLKSLSISKKNIIKICSFSLSSHIRFHLIIG